MQPKARSLLTIIAITVTMMAGWCQWAKAGVLDFYSDWNIEKTCKAAAAQTSIKYIEPTITYITQETSEALKANSPYQNSRYHTLAGLTVDVPFMQVKVNTQTFEQGDSICYKNSLMGEVGFKDIKVYVAREFSQDECFKQEVLKHEAQHLLIHRTVMHDLEGKLLLATSGFSGYLMHKQDETIQRKVDKLKASFNQAMLDIHQQDEDYDQNYRQDPHLMTACEGRLYQQFIKVRTLGDL